jgi:hypothetical protein
MSLVYEALRKAEREKERKTGTPPVREEKPVVPVKPVASPPPAPAPANRLETPSRGYLSMLIACVSVVALVGIVYMVLLATKNVVSSPTAPPIVTAAGTPSVTTATEPAASPASTPPAPATPTENDSRFKLTGIMKMGDSFGAVINGRVVYQDNYVDGAVVKKVERDRVTLDVNGREAVLRLF